MYHIASISIEANDTGTIYCLRSVNKLSEFAFKIRTNIII